MVGSGRVSDGAGDGAIREYQVGVLPVGVARGECVLELLRDVAILGYLDCIGPWGQYQHIATIRSGGSGARSAGDNLDGRALYRCPRPGRRSRVLDNTGHGSLGQTHLSVD